MPPVMKRLRKEARGHEEAHHPPKPIDKKPLLEMKFGMIVVFGVVKRHS